jgi:hypothetical protein
MTFEFPASLAKALPSTTLGFVWMSGASLPTRVGKLRKLFALAATALFCACSGGGGLADVGGMSGTGISQGAVTSFGSVFVNGVEWDLTSSTTIEIDGAPAIESDLRLGMVVRITGDLAPTGTPSTAIDIVFDDAIEGPIENDPVALSPDGLEKSFSVLGTRIIMNEETTAFDGGASFAGLRADDVVEVSGLIDDIGVVRATRIRLVGVFPANLDAELRGLVSDLGKNPDGSGDFSIGTILVHYVASTDFSDLTRASLANGDFIEAKGTLRIAGDELDADEIELEIQGLGSGSIDNAEIEGFVSNFVSNGRFEVSGTLVDASAAVFDPPGFDLTITNGARVEVEGRLENGVLIADSVEDEDEAEDVKIEAAVSSVDLAGQTQTIVVLGVTISADGKTRIEDDRDENQNLSFGFGDIEAGDWLEIRGLQTGPSTVLALRIKRDTPGDDVILEGPVTSLDVNALTLSITIIDQPIPLDLGTLYFDALEQSRTEEEFFRNPGDVMIGDIVQAKDEFADDLQILSEADEVAIEGD